MTVSYKHIRTKRQHRSGSVSFLALSPKTLIRPWNLFQTFQQTIYTPNNRASKCLKQKLIKLKREIDKSTFVVRNCRLPSATENY